MPQIEDLFSHGRSTRVLVQRFLLQLHQLELQKYNIKLIFQEK